MPRTKQNPDISAKAFQRKLLDWFDRHRRAMPWRAPKGKRSDPYHVWLSEVMLQQTTVTAVKPYFEKFLKRWPAVRDLARAEQEEVLQAWAGLGYYARARNLHKCAKIISAGHGGRFPDTEAELLKLPGIGPYSAAAIAAIAFDKSAVAVDGNVERVTARLFNIRKPLPGAKPELKKLAQSMGKGAGQPGDFVQAFMELGATVCTPRARCSLCPVKSLCKTADPDKAAELPRRMPKKQKPERQGIVFWLEDGKGKVLVRRRPEKGLLGGMTEFPSTPWETPGTKPSIPAFAKHCKNTGLQIGHSFTHFNLTLEIFAGKAKAPSDGFWHDIRKLDDLALPSVMKKVLLRKLAGKAEIGYNQKIKKKRG